MDKDFLNILTKININNLDFNNHEYIKNTIVSLFNIIENVSAQNKQLIEKVQSLTNEINGLKGEKGKPNIKPNIKEKANVTKLSHLEKKKKPWKKSTKNDKIEINREETITIDKYLLPIDAEFNGYNTKTIQNIIIMTDNVFYKMETYYSKSENKTYSANLPNHLVDSSFGAELKAFVYSMYYECRVTEPKIAEILNSKGIKISEGTISNILIKNKSDEFLKDKQEILAAAIEVSEYHQIDDTGMRVNGVNHYATILCNEYYTSFFIRRYKNRETVMKILCGIDEDKKVDFTELKTLIKILIADDAPQFKKTTEKLGLCWIHEERHYEKLIPLIQNNKELVEKIIAQIWDYYKELKQFKEFPVESLKVHLRNKFDSIFQQCTGYDDLDNRLKLTHHKKDYLLLVLDFPNIPLQNNESEIGNREFVVKRKISGGVRTKEGKTAWENALSIYTTCKKNGIDFHSYVLGIFKGDLDRIHLSDVIRERYKNEKNEKSKFVEVNLLNKTG